MSLVGRVAGNPKATVAWRTLVLVALAFVVVLFLMDDLHEGSGHLRNARTHQSHTQSGNEDAAAGDTQDEVLEAWMDLDDEDPDTVRWCKEVLVVVRAADDGAPVEGAAVRVLVSWRPEEFRAGTTDPTGRVRLKACDRSAVIWVRAPGFLVRAFKVETGAEPVDVSLQRGRPLRGRVVRASDDEPLAAAEVYVWDEGTGEEVDYRPEQYGSLRDGGLSTDTDGYFSVAAIPNGRPVTIAARASGLGVTTTRLPAGAVGGHVILRLGGGGVLEGTVTLDDGQPARRVRVYAATAGDAGGLRHPESRWFAGGSMRFLPYSETDGSGHYRIEGLPAPARLLPVAVGKERAQGAGEPATLRHPTAYARRDFPLVTPAWPSVRGHAPDGSLVTPVHCDLLRPDGSPVEDPFFSGSSSYTSGSGEYSLHTRPPGRWLLVACAEEPWRPARVLVDLAPGEWKTIDVTFEPGLGLEGVVVDGEGSAVCGARVRATDGTIFRRAWTDACGAFRLTGLPEGMLDVEAEDEDGFLVAANVRSTCPAFRPLHIVLLPRPVVVGRVVPPPKRGWHVRARIRTADVERLCYPTFGARGAFRLPDVPVGGPFDLILSHDRDGGCPRLWSGLRVEVGARVDLGNIRFPKGRTLNGVVSDAAGRPLAFARVVADETVARRESRTNEEGRFEISGVPEHPIHLAVQAEGHATLHAVVDPTAPVALRCRAGVRVTGSLVHPDANEVSGRRLRFIAVSGGDLSPPVPDEATTDSVGAFEIHLAPGEYDVWTVREGTDFSQCNRVRVRDRNESRLGQIHVMAGADLQIQLGLQERQ